MLHALRYDLRVIIACAKKDIKSGLTERAFTIISIILPVNILVLLSLFVLAGSQAPTAVVMADTGPHAQQFYTAMIHAHSFRLQQTTASSAQQLLAAGKVVAVVTIPAEFDSRVDHHAPVQVNVDINNLNTDFTNDIRRAVPLSITSFYAAAFPNLVSVVPNEQDAYPQDTDYIPYLTVSILVVGLLVGGLLLAGTGAAREWERETMKELLLAPASRWAMLLGKMLGAFVLSLAGVVVLLAVLVLAIGVRPVHWGEVAVFTVLTLTMSIAVGTLLGTWIRQRQAVTALSIGTTLPLFFLSGAFGPISFTTRPLQLLARSFPVYYAIVLFQHAFHNFRLNTLGVATNGLVLAGYTLLVIALAAVILRRSTLAH
ncbi:MAG: ABC transporter permease [Herpetosiphonaceae bacterium]|nr:ABC transporter permease [Herpetosiphonaceae bacterium]